MPQNFCKCSLSALHTWTTSMFLTIYFEILGKQRRVKVWTGVDFKLWLGTLFTQTSVLTLIADFETDIFKKTNTMELIVTQQVKKIPSSIKAKSSYRIYNSSTLSISTIRWVGSTLPYVISLRSIWILYFRISLYLPIGLFSSDFQTNIFLPSSSPNLGTHIERTKFL